MKDGEESDANLVQGLRHGDVAAFEVVYRRYHPRIYSFLARLTQDRGAAEDLLQDTWLRVARSARGLEAETRLVAWLLTIARNLFISRERRYLNLERFRPRLTNPCNQPTPFDLASAGETERRLEDALAALPCPQREIILLVAVEGLAPSEAAEVLSISPESARQRLARARCALEKQLDEREPSAVAGGRR